MYCNPEPLNFCFAAMNRRVLLQAILANREGKKKRIQEVAASPDVATEIWMDVAAAAALFYSELNGVFTLMRTLWNSEGFLGGKDVFHFTPCRLWQVFSETLRHIAAPRLCSDVESVRSCNQVLLTDSTCSEGNAIGPTERDGKCLPNQPPRLAECFSADASVK